MKMTATCGIQKFRWREKNKTLVKILGVVNTRRLLQVKYWGSRPLTPMAKGWQYATRCTNVQKSEIWCQYIASVDTIVRVCPRQFREQSFLVYRGYSSTLICLVCRSLLFAARWCHGKILLLLLLYLQDVADNFYSIKLSWWHQRYLTHPHKRRRRNVNVFYEIWIHIEIEIWFWLPSIRSLIVPIRYSITRVWDFHSDESVVIHTVKWRHKIYGHDTISIL